MKITLAMVSSVDGKTTKWDDPHIYTWTSKEDRDHFFSLRDQSSVLIMGRKTYESAKSIMKLSPNTLRIVMTNQVSNYQTELVSDQLEFTDASPTELVSLLENRGYSESLLVGGAEINAEFFKAKLINEVWLTIEPVIFGEGNPLVWPQMLDVALQLESVEKMNQQGTLLVKYTVK